MIGSTRKRNSYVPAALVALSLALVPAATQAQPATDVELELVLSGMDTTVDLQGTHVAGDDRLFAVGRHGVIEIINFDGLGSATLDPTPFLDINTLVHSASGEQGLLGLAFHPDYDTNGYFFVNYTCDADAPAPTVCANDGDTMVARYTVTADPDDANEGSELVLVSCSRSLLY